MRSMQLSDRTMPLLDLSTTNGRAQQPRTQQTRTHPGYSLIDNIKQRTRCAGAAAERFDQLEVSYRNVVENQVILRLEIDNVADVVGPGALCFLCVSQARSGGADRLGPARQSITVQRAHAELFD